jgi:hypothetical protein
MLEADQFLTFDERQSKLASLERMRIVDTSQGEDQGGRLNPD